MSGRPRDDSGVTLVELVVAMAIATIAGAIFTGAILQLYRVTHHVESAAIAQTQLNVAFMRLDKQIRYAEGISTPGAAGSDQYVEYLTTNTGTATCAQLRLAGTAQQLQWRSWTRGGTPGGWTVLASGVSSTTPFTLSLPTAGSAHQTLTTALTTTADGAPKQLRVIFTARNSTRITESADYCVEGRKVT